jgi:hypothetical protein
VDLARAKPYRSSHYCTTLATELTKEQLLQMAWVIGAGFPRWEPQACHLRPPKHPPAVPKSAEPLEDVTTSPNGFLADKDSGGMFYVIRLA